MAGALAGAVGTPGRMACPATHGRGRSATIGSVAVSLLDRSPRPIMLVGPAARPVTPIDAWVVAVDGTAHDHAVASVALGWAARLARQVDLMTVAEPGQPGRPQTGERGHPRSPREPDG